ncbi:MAG TPA: cytochrome c peroxidase [Flavilitoribacter sp.]|nr:cytochrome c peroxidase [Flavilitoribacter sp.]
MKHRFHFLLMAAILLAGCQPENTDYELDLTLEETLKQASGGIGKTFYQLPKSHEYDKIPQDPNNPLTSEKVLLGQLLFHETGLALAPVKSTATGTYACASCHFASAGFQAGRFQGLSEGGHGFGLNGEDRKKLDAYDEPDVDCQPVRPPAALNAAYQEVTLWNGQFGATGPNAGTETEWEYGTPKEDNHLGFQGLETQAIAGLKVHRMEINRDFLRDKGYIPLFDAAFPGAPAGERYTREKAGLAIAAYERTLLANRAPFQEWLGGNIAAMSDKEKLGAILFFGSAGCATCHNGPSLANMDFYAMGMNDLSACPEPVFRAPKDDPARFGRGSFTRNNADNYKFKVPQLYNLSDSPFYGHGSSFRSVREVVAYLNAGQPENPEVPKVQLAPNFRPLGLTEEEIDQITFFLEQSLRDPELLRFQPGAVLSGQCFPVNDPEGRADLGCE